MTAILQQLRRLNLPIMAALPALLGLGVLFIYSAAFSVSEQSGLPLYQKQMAWITLGFACFLIFALTDYHVLTRFAWLFYAVGIILLLLVFVPHIGVKMYGARRWIQLLGVRILQPAEFMKIAFVILMVRLFGYPGRNVRRWRYALLGTVLTLAPFLLIIRQPDLGTALIFFPVFLAVMFAAGVPGRIISWFVGAGLLAVLVVLMVVLLPPRLGADEREHKQLLGRIGINAYQRERILVFFDTSRDPLGSGWNKAQSQIAVGSGGLLGKGFMRGTQNILGFLPRTVTPTDFVFSVIAEERGFVGALATLLLFGLLLYGMLRTAFLAADKMGTLLCAGIMIMLFCHIFINMAMTIGLMPITGIPLPFLSYGGTFMVTSMSALGMVQSVHIRGDWRS